MDIDISLSVANHAASSHLNNKMKIGSALVAIAAFILVIGLFNQLYHPALLIAFFAAAITGSLLYTNGLYANTTAGVKNNGIMFKSISSKGVSAWMLGIFLTLFYVLLYWYPQYLGLNGKGNVGLVRFFDPLSKIIDRKSVV